MSKAAPDRGPGEILRTADPLNLLKRWRFCYLEAKQTV